MTRDERLQAIKFQDAIGEIVDQFLRDGMRSDVVSEVLRDEADSSEARRSELEQEANAERNAHVAEPFRSILNSFADIPAALARAQRGR